MLAGMAGTLCGQTSNPETPASDLKKLSLDELLELEVTSVSKKEETQLLGARHPHHRR